ADFTPTISDDPSAPPAPPLGKLKDWVSTTCPACGGPAQRETNTMPQWAGSCWYYLRYLDPKNDRRICDAAVEKYWMGPSRANPTGGVDLYVGGAEHAVLHLLYSRFWHKVLFDLGYVSSPEPFGRLFNQGMIRSFAYRDKRGICIPYEMIDFSGEKPVHKETGELLVESVEKMSKSLKNVVNPDEVIGQYGADTLRLYEMFMGPLEASKPWNTRDVPGVHRFLQRSWRMVAGSEDMAPLVGEGANAEVEVALHKLTKKVGEDIEAMKFNTAIAAMMEFVNLVYRAGAIAKGQVQRYVQLLAPFAPHLGEELWSLLGHEQSLSHEPWPTYDESVLAEDTVELPVQVNGKIRGRIVVGVDLDEHAVLEVALANDDIAKHVEGKTIVKKIVVPGRLVNIVVK
ncbi:MAG: class I tRNA ligase family protein, partial [Planctomycetota bacterium]|nr:class I tRNA ligase family protein [Planctomycetota bacterium]